ncbi:MAG: hypothetical protein ACRDTN_09645, partial [Mycobacterium sp.]
MPITKLGPADIYARTGMDPADIDRIAAATRPATRVGRPPRFTHRGPVLLVLACVAHQQNRACAGGDLRYQLVHRTPGNSGPDGHDL